MFEYAQKKEMDAYRFQAALQGVDFDKGVKKPDIKSDMLFGSPEDYEGMSEEEKQAATDKMLVKFKGWADGNPMQGAKIKVM